MAELFSIWGWKADLISNELGYLAEELSKQSAKDMAWFLIVVYGKMWGERDKLRKELLSNMESELELFGGYLAYSDCKWC